MPPEWIPPSYDYKPISFKEPEPIKITVPKKQQVHGLYPEIRFASLTAAQVFVDSHNSGNIDWSLAILPLTQDKHKRYKPNSAFKKAPYELYLKETVGSSTGFRAIYVAVKK